MRLQFFKTVLGSVCGFLAALLIPVHAAGGPFTRLQVLLPGETEAPGTITGKLGTPEYQTVGVPFTIMVRACDDEWYTVDNQPEGSGTFRGSAGVLFKAIEMLEQGK